MPPIEQMTEAARSTRRAARSGRKEPVRLDPITIECVSPELDGGRYPVKRVVGDTLVVGADVFKDGHDLVAARVRYRAPGATAWRAVPMRFEFSPDRWLASFPLDRIGLWEFTVEAWTDRFNSWRSGLEKKVAAKQKVEVELLEGAQIVLTAARNTKSAAYRSSLQQVADRMRDETMSQEARARAALAPELKALVDQHYAPDDLTEYRNLLTVRVDRPAAAFASWYEMFPRSATDDPRRHGTFRSAEGMLPRIAELGFDVVYLPPIHPIGTTFRKGKNNSLTPEPDDVGSPWAIGNEDGGHDAVDPKLGTIEDFERFVQRAGALGLEVALDFALQCSPDHPWVKEHPDWFHIRPDGTIAYAENPPKKYQDIYPLNFWCDDREGLWTACRDLLLFWVARGVKQFRVDNPHTKAFAFWEWCIAEVQRLHPEVVFFAEAFTRPKRMKSLAKLGFTQSYTYFTWKNTRWELVPYLEELTQGPAAEYFRGNFFANTPDILHEYLQHGGRPAFRIRLLLAGTLLPLYGIYSGYELCENVPVRAGSEEYLDSEKYQIRVRDFDAPGNINADIRMLNRIRRGHAALQQYANLAFHTSENEQLLFYRKAGRPIATVVDGLEIPPSIDTHVTNEGGGRREAGEDSDLDAHGTTGVPASLLPHPVSWSSDADLLIVVNLDPHRIHDSMVHVPLEEMGIGADEPYVVHDLLTGAHYTWRGSRNYVRLDPQLQPGHVLRVERP